MSTSFNLHLIYDSRMFHLARLPTVCIPPHGYIRVISHMFPPELLSRGVVLYRAHVVVSPPRVAGSTQLIVQVIIRNSLIFTLIYIIWVFEHRNCRTLMGVLSHHWFHVHRRIHFTCSTLSFITPKWSWLFGAIWNLLHIQDILSISCMPVE